MSNSHPAAAVPVRELCDSTANPVFARSAILSECGQYRYSLMRRWGALRDVLVWVMLNPSTADAEIDDPTIRRCMGFARSWGYGGIEVLNLFAFRATDPKRLPDERHSAVGPLNDSTIKIVAGRRDVICAWGCHGTKFGRDLEVLDLLRASGASSIRALETTKDGHPKHPLYVAASTVASDFRVLKPIGAADEK